MQQVTINQRPYTLECQAERAGGFTLVLGAVRRARGWRGWLGQSETVAVGWLEVQRKGVDEALCQQQQGMFARASLDILPEWQGLGLGTYLLREGIRTARKEGVVLAGLLEGDEPERLWTWFLKRGMDLVSLEDQPSKVWVLGRKARAAQASVAMTLLVLAEPGERQRLRSSA